MLGFLAGWSLGSHDTEIKSIIVEHHWPPNIIDNLFCDGFDYHGIVWHYELLKEMHEKIKGKK